MTKIRTGAVAAGLALALLALPGGAIAEPAPVKHPIAQQKPHVLKKTTVAPARRAAAAPQQRAYKDPDTGKPRAATASEAQALDGAQALPLAPVRVLEWSDGSVAAELPDEAMTDLVAVRRADGTVTTGCAPARDRGKLPARPAPAPKLEEK